MGIPGLFDSDPDSFPHRFEQRSPQTRVHRRQRSVVAAARPFAFAAVFAAAAALTSPPRALAESPASVLEEAPHYGVYYDRYEPAFYTGFAPRTLDPARIQLHIGRGNQLRATVVLADDVLREYARDLATRRDTIRALVSSRELVLTQNDGLARFEGALSDAGLDRLVSEEQALAPDVLRERNLALLERLNPRRIFRIHTPVDDLVRQWTAALRPEDREHLDTARRLDLINRLLPTRLFVAEADAGTEAELAALVRVSPQGGAALDQGALAALRAPYLHLLDRVSHGIYPHRDGALDFAEFTAIWPVGTWNQSTTLHGRPIPEYPTPGRRALTTHQRSQLIDHVADEPIYSWFPWLPYMHVGDHLHNAIHLPYWQMRTSQTSFLPATWRQAKDADGHDYEYLWLLSRGPMSHGCTHLNAGHISELRQLLPSAGDQLGNVDVFYNTSAQYDVFDIHGTLHPEVMGVRYFIAYSLDGVRPGRLRVRDERHAYYDWLYAGELQYDGADHGVFDHVEDCRFVGRSALTGRGYDRIPLYEADYEPEKVQFYRKTEIPFIRELRTVSVRHPFPGLDVTAQAIPASNTAGN
ncbi:MAG TPA: hypothetical protein VGK20_08280 [Candidatus Binatia bacterium]